MIVVVCLGPRPVSRADIAKVPAPARAKAPPTQLIPAPRPTPWITIGNETSVVTGPVGPNGYVDYLAALNKAISDGVTVDNNAAVLLVRAIEISSLNGADQAEFFNRLGIKPPPPAAGRFKEVSDLTGNPSDNGLVSSVPWSAEEFPARARWLTRHEQALEVAIEATRRSPCYFPLVRPVGKKLYELPLVGLQALHQLGRALTAPRLARNRLRQGWRGQAGSHRLPPTRPAGGERTLPDACDCRIGHRRHGNGRRSGPARMRQTVRDRCARLSGRIEKTSTAPQCRGPFGSGGTPDLPRFCHRIGVQTANANGLWHRTIRQNNAADGADEDHLE